MYRIGSCACNSMGRGRPFGPPRVRASRKRFKIEVERVVPRTVNTSLRTGRGTVFHVSHDVVIAANR